MFISQGRQTYMKGFQRKVVFIILSSHMMQSDEDSSHSS